MKKIKFFYPLLLAVLITACDTSANKDKKDTKETSTDSTKKDTEVTAKNLPPVDEKATYTAQILAGVETKGSENDTTLKHILNLDATKKHYQEFNAQWSKLEEGRLKKMRPWRDKELKDLNQAKHNLIYPFSGPDFLNAYEFFPNCDNYVMFGLEKIGEFPNFQTAKDEYIAKYLANVRDALSEIFERNYFITSYMGGDLHIKVMRGVIPVISIFLARTNNKIVKIEKFYLSDAGKPVFETTKEKGKIEGLMIEFLNANKTYSQKIYYFGTDVQEKEIEHKPELITFIKSFDNKIAFVKSASYLLHGYQFKTMRELLLSETTACLQDDTGIPYSFYKKEGWQVDFYGKYAKPVADFNYGYQKDVAEIYKKDSIVKPIDFSYGYHWNDGKASIMICRKK